MRRAFSLWPRSFVCLALFAVGVGSVLLAQGGTAAQGKRLSLESPEGLRLHSAAAVPAVLDGRKGLKVTFSAGAADQTPGQPLAVVEGVELGNGVIEAEIAGAPAPEAGEGARGFVGIAFRLQADLKTYDAFYLRPTNGRAEDQERRNHAVQYISQPDWTWARLRKETPSKYEAYVDLQPNVWTPIRIDVRGDKARLYVHGQSQPTLIVNDVKTGAGGRGAVALWIERGTVAHFRNLSVQPAP